MEALQMKTWAEISLENISHNYAALRAALPAGCRLLAVMKADAYGHGAREVAPFVQKLGADYFAVSSIDEALQLRSFGVTRPLLILGYTPPDCVPLLLREGITQEVDSTAAAQALSAAAVAAGGRLRVHLKVDSGMGRLGFVCREGRRPDAEMAAVLALPGLEAEGIFTHFAVADAGDGEYTGAQFSRFTALVSRLESETGFKFRIRHCANTGAVINYPETALDMVRPGLALYGHYPARATGGLDLRPAMQFKTRIVSLKELETGDSVSYGRTYFASGPTRAAVIPVGYGDGLHRALSGKMEVLLHGRRVPQIGRICMDMCMLDVSGVPCAIGDPVTIFGENEGAFLPVEEQAEKAGTISYEMTCSLAPRVPRIYR